MTIDSYRRRVHRQHRKFSPGLEGSPRNHVYGVLDKIRRRPRVVDVHETGALPNGLRIIPYEEVVRRLLAR